MNFHPEDFLALEEEVERQGGAVLPDTCRGVGFNIMLPNERGKRVPTRKSTCRCNNKTLLAIPRLVPDDPDEEVTEKDDELVILCAVCDDAGKMPRFRDVIDHDRSG